MRIIIEAILPLFIVGSSCLGLYSSGTRTYRTYARESHINEGIVYVKYGYIVRSTAAEASTYEYTVPYTIYQLMHVITIGTYCYAVYEYVVNRRNIFIPLQETGG